MICSLTSCLLKFFVPSSAWSTSLIAAKEREQQDEEFARFQAKSERRADNADSVMSNYWRADEDLDEDEQFLRDYVMNRQWLETDSL